MSHNATCPQAGVRGPVKTPALQLEDMKDDSINRFSVSEVMLDDYIPSVLDRGSCSVVPVEIKDPDLPESSICEELARGSCMLVSLNDASAPKDDDICDQFLSATCTLLPLETASEQGSESICDDLTKGTRTLVPVQPDNAATCDIEGGHPDDIDDESCAFVIVPVDDPEMTEDMKNKCVICAVKFENAEALSHHLEAHLKGVDDTIACILCEKRFDTMRDLEKHVCAVYKEQMRTRWTCPLCQNVYGEHRYLVRHFKTHTGEKPYGCSQCSGRFRERSHLIAHVKCVHSNDRPFMCTTCNKRFVFSEHLTRHMHVHTGARPHKCEECGKSFKSVSNLYRHQRSHLNIRAYVCAVCDQRFSQVAGLNSHMRTHTKERPYKCTQCPKTFAKKCGLTRHEHIHANLRPFQCTICDRTFREKSHMQTHIKKIHRGTKL